MLPPVKSVDIISLIAMSCLVIYNYPVKKLNGTFISVFDNNDGTVSTSNSEQETEIEFEPFVMLEKGSKIKGTNFVQYIGYDPETKVMYTLVFNRVDSAAGITVLLNENGTPKLYDPKGEKTE